MCEPGDEVSLPDRSPSWANAATGSSWVSTMSQDQFSCPNCGHEYALALEMAGRRGRCKVCKHVFRIPGAAPPAAVEAVQADADGADRHDGTGQPDRSPSWANGATGSSWVSTMSQDQFSCPNCGHEYALAPEMAGRRGRCKVCKHVFRIPGAAPPASVEAAQADADGADRHDGTGQAASPGTMRPVPDAEPLNQAAAVHPGGDECRCPNPKCPESWIVPNELIGRKARCRKCYTIFVIKSDLTSRVSYQAIASQSPPPTVSAVNSQPWKSFQRPWTPPPNLPKQFGRYRMKGLLSRGGVSSVYKAQDTENEQRRVALRIPHFGPIPDDALCESFYREARIAVTFDHPNLCPVYEVDAIDGVHYMAMPFLEGPTLSKCLADRQHLPQREVASLVRMIALAMDAAHARGVVHGGLKTANIMTDLNDLVVILDFGLSFRADWLDIDEHGTGSVGENGRTTSASSISGTLAYMAPERVSGDSKEIGPPSDIYSLGVILYELLTGRLPFNGPVKDVLNEIKSSQPTFPGALRFDLNTSLESICLKAMAKKPGDRFVSMREFAASLKLYLERSGCKRPGPLPAGFLSPKPKRRDAPTSEERQLVAWLLSGEGMESHPSSPTAPRPKPVVRPSFYTSARGGMVVGDWFRIALYISACLFAVCLLCDAWLAIKHLFSDDRTVIPFEFSRQLFPWLF